MKKKFLFVILNDYADCEGAYLATTINKSLKFSSESYYEIKVVAAKLNEVRSLGGFRTIPNYNFNTISEYYATLILIGTDSWLSEEADNYTNEANYVNTQPISNNNMVTANDTGFFGIYPRVIVKA